MLINILALASAGVFLCVPAGSALRFQLPGGLALFGLFLAVLEHRDG